MRQAPSTPIVFRRRQRRTAAEIAALLSEHRQSGLTQRAFAESRGLKLSTLTNWLQKRKRVGAGEEATRLIPVRLLGARDQNLSVGECFELVLSANRRLRIPQRFDEGAFLRLLHALEAGC